MSVRVLRKYSEIFRSLCAMVDLIAVSAAFAAAYFARFHLEWVVPPSDRPHALNYVGLWLTALPVYHLLLRSYGLYEPRRQASRIAEAVTLIKVAAFGTLLLAAASFFVKEIAISRLTLLFAFGFAAAALVALRGAIRLALVMARKRGFNTRRVVIAGTGRLAQDIAQRLRRRAEMGFQIIGFAGPAQSGGNLGAPRHGEYEALAEIVQRLRIDHVFIALDRSDSTNPMQLVEALHDTTASVRIATDLSGVQTIRAMGEDLDGVPILCVVDAPVLGWDKVVKRGMDIAVSALALVLCAPLMALIAAAIRLSSPNGPVFYRQRRVSLDAREFTMLKFRTMVPAAEAKTGPTWAIQHDPRCTPLGRFLRRTSLDELPQLWNVLRGEMSLVGPRPERPELIEGFRREIGGYMLRHKVKGGLTGLAQVEGLRGNTPLESRIHCDLRYACEWSLGLDLRIILQTALRVFRDPNAY